MARAPIDYTLNVLNPMQEALKGYSFGLSEVQAEKDEARNVERFGMEKQRFGMEQERFEMQKRAEAERRAQAARNAAIAQRAEARKQEFFSDFSSVVNGDVSRKDLLAKYPDFAATMKSTFDLIPNEAAESRVNLGRQVQIALNNDRPDVARSQLEQQRDAALNSGDANYARQIDIMLEQLEQSPSLVFEQIGLGIEAYGGKSEDRRVVDSVAVSPLGKIAADVKAGLIPKSVLDAQVRVEERAGDEGLTLSQRVSEEARLRGEYTKRTENLSSAERNFNVINTSAADSSGAGDIALVTSFMKMLDPSSVVRETEFATAANAGGLVSRLKAISKKVEDGQFLSVQQREDFKRLAGEYLAAAQEQEQGVKSSYQAIVDNYGLNPVNVFGGSAVTSQGGGTRIRYDAEGNRIE